MATKHEQVKEILDHVSDSEIRITYLPDGCMRVDFSPRKKVASDYQLVQENLETFLAQVETETGTGLPDFVKDEFEAFPSLGP